MQPIPDGIFKLLFTSDAAWNETGWNNTQFDSLVNGARAVIDPATRTDLHTKARVSMNWDVPALITAFFDVLWAKRSWLQDYDIHPRSSRYRPDHAWLTAKAPCRGG